MLDAEFEAFQAGYPLEAGFLEPQSFSTGLHGRALEPSISQPRLPDWASDFQDLRLNEARASPIPQSQFYQHAPLQRSSPTSWHQDFLGQQGQSSSYQPWQQQRHASEWAHGYTGGLVSQDQTTLSARAQQKQPEMQVEDNFDEAAFEKAFEAATAEFQQSEKAELQYNATANQDLYAGLSPETESWMDQTRIGADRISYEAQQKDKHQDDHDEADELARTAGQLLENVRADQSQKFRESNFLSLMRQLRDREVRVEGDKLVDVSMPSSTPT